MKSYSSVIATLWWLGISVALAMALSACGSGPFPTPMASVMAKPPVTMMDTPLPLARPTPASGIALGLPTPTQPLSLATSTPSATPTPAIPAYFAPHPSLHCIASKPQYSWFDYQPRWKNNQVVIYLERETELANRCFIQVETTYTLTGIYASTTTTHCVSYDLVDSPTPTPTLPPSIRAAGVGGENVFERRFSPDGRTLLIRAQVSSPLPAPQLGQHSPLPGDVKVAQNGWLVAADGGTARLIFYATEEYKFVWTLDSQYLVAEGLCYGGARGALGLGIYTIEAKTGAIYTINSSFALCEGRHLPLVAPDCEHILYDPGIVATLKGDGQARLCGENEFARSYAWSQDGRYAYASCGNSKADSDMLWRYDTQTGEHHALTDPSRVAFKMMNIAVSPDQRRIVFAWGTSDFMNSEPFGLWLLDLTKLD